MVFNESRPNRSISEVTRRNIFDLIFDDSIVWTGRLTETDFLARLYNLKSLPSHDDRYKCAHEDIRQHCERNPGDWLNDWIVTDSRFDLLNSSDEVFLQFLCEVIDPVVQPNKQEVDRLLEVFNSHLKADGWEIAARTYISGKPIFAARHRILDGAAALEAAKPLMVGLNAEYVTRQITRMEASVESDPELAIGTAKEFLETIAKTILRECGEVVSNKTDLPHLVKEVRQKLELLPQNIPEKAKGAEIIKRMLSNLGTVAQGLAELRSLYGSGHGKDAKVKGLKPRHARLAVNAACTLAVFLFETYQERGPIIRPGVPDLGQGSKENE